MGFEPNPAIFGQVEFILVLTSGIWGFSKEESKTADSAEAHTIRSALHYITFINKGDFCFNWLVSKFIVNCEIQF